jgi:hypothetical protein
MTNKQKELLKAMHLIKNHCASCESCETCWLICDRTRDGCPFEEVPAKSWDLKPLEEEKEKDFSVFS